ncbi:MAG: transposase [Ruminococcus sp.]|nr:transposase [Ruminococcus sp.]
MNVIVHRRAISLSIFINLSNLTLYAKDVTTRQISETIIDINGFEGSGNMVSDITDHFLPSIEDWQKSIFEEMYPIVYISKNIN